jgi:hypothetical protein
MTITPAPVRVRGRTRPAPDTAVRPTSRRALTRPLASRVRSTIPVNSFGPRLRASTWCHTCSSTPREVTPAERDSWAARRSSSGLIARHSVFHDVPSRRARPWIVACSRRSCPIAHAIARVVIDPRAATRFGTCSANVPRSQSGSGQRHMRCLHTTRTATSPGTSRSSRNRLPRLGATTPQVGQPINFHGVETVTVIRPSPRSTVSTRTPSKPSRTSQREQSVVGAGTHPVALDNVEVLEIDQHAWSLLIIGDLDTHPVLITPRASLPGDNRPLTYQLARS